MAQYKVPQDVEADDKLLGPFTFRQLAYLLIAAGFIGLAVLFFQIFPALCVIPALPALFLVILALPLKKDQPMETYIAALVSYYTKPRKRTWMTGQSESTIMISAPKINPEDNRVRNISGEEATNRLSFLADIVDSQGAAINGIANSTMRDDLAAEAQAATDIFEQDSYMIDRAIKADEDARREELKKKMQAAKEEPKIVSAPEPVAQPAVVSQPAPQPASTAPSATYAEEMRRQQEAQRAAELAALKHQEEVNKMREAINKNENIASMPSETPKINRHFFEEISAKTKAAEEPAKPEIIMPEPQPQPVEKPVEKTISENPPKQAIIDLANNQDFSVETIAKQANKINNRKDDGEVFISLH